MCCRRPGSCEEVLPIFQLFAWARITPQKKLDMCSSVLLSYLRFPTGQWTRSSVAFSMDLCRFIDLVNILLQAMALLSLMTNLQHWRQWSLMERYARLCTCCGMCHLVIKPANCLWSKAKFEWCVFPPAVFTHMRDAFKESFYSEASTHAGHHVSFSLILCVLHSLLCDRNC